MRTAIILVTFNGWDMTRNCLKDLSTAMGDAAHFVVAVADNASTDGTPQKIRAEFPAVHLYESQKNLGFGAANNAAIEGLIRDGEPFDAICLLNNDTRLSADTVSKLRQALESSRALSKDRHRFYPVVVPAVKNPDGSEQCNYFAGLGPDGIGYLPFFANAFRNESGAAAILQGTPRPTPLKGFEEVHWASGVCWMFDRELYNVLCSEKDTSADSATAQGQTPRDTAANGTFFDETIFMYYEDGDLALRARQTGARFFICNDIALTHLGGGSAQSNTSRALQHDRSQQYVFQKHFGLRGLLLSKSFRVCRSLVRIAASLPRCIKGSAKKRAYVKHHWTLLKAALW